MVLTVRSDGWLVLPDKRMRCALGKGGVRPVIEKREGDGATPLGRFPMRRVLFRPDRGPQPVTQMPIQPISPTDGWCDAPGDPAYNRPVTLPYPASAEALWRAESVYDLIVVLGHNDDPVIDGAGSAIFMHIARRNYSPTEGCIALDRTDLETILRAVTPADQVDVIDV